MRYEPYRNPFRTTIYERWQRMRDNEEQTYPEPAIYQDSVTIGTSAKGLMKVYGDASKPEDFKKRVDHMAEVLAHAQAKYKED